MGHTKQSVKLQNVNIKTHKYTAFSRWRFSSSPQMTIPFRLYMHASSTKAHQAPWAAAGLRINSHGTETDVSIHPPHTYMKTTKNWQLCWLVTYFNIW